MPTLLTSKRMSPELRARIAESLRADVKSRALGARSMSSARLTRLLLFGTVLGLTLLLTVTYRKSREEFRAAHSALEKSYQEAVAPFDAGYRERLAFIDDFLRRAHEPYPGDVVDQSISGNAQALERALSGPLVYVRGPLRGFMVTSDRRRTWGEEGPDAFVRCLALPPPADTESALLRHLGKVFEPAAFVGTFVNLDDAFSSVEFVDSGLGGAISSAGLMSQLESLQRRLQAAHLERGLPFSEARSFVYVLDEAKTKGTASDFDGEAEHFMRVGVIDLETKRTLLRARRQVSPEWISEKSRLLYSRQLDGCKLAFDLKQELTASRN